MKSSTLFHAPPQSSLKETRCRLLALPLELQLQIYTLVVCKTEPLLLNAACNSSYRDRYDVMRIEDQEWHSGARHPPLQPAISRTCRAIRVETLPLFYGENVFRACYCSPKTMLPPVIAWLKMIGPDNREMLRHLYFYDRNETQDKFFGYRLTKGLGQSEIFSLMLGRMETMSSASCCCHLVVFGDGTRKDGVMPLGKVTGVPRLRLEGEI